MSEEVRVSEQRKNQPNKHSFSCTRSKSGAESPRETFNLKVVEVEDKVGGLCRIAECSLSTCVDIFSSAAYRI